ncbi:hypothetical protein Tco_1342034 [Tanacetum coccineum]
MYIMTSPRTRVFRPGPVWGCDRLVSRANVMAAPVISISSDTSEESVGSHAPRVILFVDYSPSSDSDPSEDSLPPAPDLPLVSPFLCSDDSEADGESEPAEQRPVSSSHDTLAPLSEFPLAPVVAPPGIRRLRPIPARRLAWRRVSHHSSDRHSSPDSSSSSAPSDHSLSRHTPPDTIDADSSTPQRFSSLGSSSERSLDSSSSSYRPSRKRCRFPTASVPSPTHVSSSIAPTPTDLVPPRKRFRDSYSLEDSKEEHIEVDTTNAEAIADVGISKGVIAHPEDGIGMGFKIAASDVREDGEEFEAEASAADTREITLDPLAIGDSSESSRGGIPDLEDTIYDHNMTITRSSITPEAIKELVNRRVEEALASHEATRAANALEAENQSQNGSDVDNGNGNNGLSKDGK